jgi:asparagine synthase (glutamine-hydrolysing)
MAHPVRLINMSFFLNRPCVVRLSVSTNFSEEVALSGPDQDTVKQLKRVVEFAIANTLGDSILLSGGLDTSIVAAVARSLKKIHAYTVALKDAPAPDLEYARLVAEKLSIPHRVYVFTNEEIEEHLKHVVKVLKCFDPMEIRNSVAVFIGLKKIKEEGFKDVMTGDASDELFGGYSFVYKLSLEKMRESLSNLWHVMQFSSIPLAKALGMEAKIPFLHPAVKEFAMKLDTSFLVGQRAGMMYGKYILRKAFESLLPERIVWREKIPIECGCGTTILPAYYEHQIDTETWKSKIHYYEEIDHVKIRDKEHLRYYEVYREIFGPPHPEDQCIRTCPSCTSNLSEKATFCTICGAYPV